MDSLPFVRIRPASGWKPLDLRQLWQYRELLSTLGRRDLTLRYRQTVLGAFWVIAQPLMAAGIFSFVFGKVANMPSDGVPYFLFAYAGLLCWNAFSNTLAKVSASLVGNSNLISKVYFPRLILPLSTLYSTLIDFAVAFAMMLVLLGANHVPIGPRLLLLPVWMAFLLMLALGTGLYVSALMVSYRDVQYILPVFVQLLLYASPVAYAVVAVPASLQLFYHLNPLTGLLEAFRWSLLGCGTLSPWVLAYSAGISCAWLVLGAFAFKRMERLFSDVI
ncbi:MAG: ABC transporter permease [Verrucomicrobiota bacterium]